MSTMKGLAVVLAAAALASGCMTARANVPVERPALDVPPVPPRVIEPAPAPEPPAPEPVPDLPEKSTAPPPKPLKSSPREMSKETAKPDTAKPEIPPVEQPPPPTPAQPTTLRTSRTADVTRIRDILTSTQKMLGSIDYQRLKPEHQSAYDQAKSHVEGAEAALKSQDFDLAKELADKAEKLARQLFAR